MNLTFEHFSELAFLITTSLPFSVKRTFSGVRLSSVLRSSTSSYNLLRQIKDKLDRNGIMYLNRKRSLINSSGANEFLEIKSADGVLISSLVFGCKE